MKAGLRIEGREKYSRDDVSTSRKSSSEKCHLIFQQRCWTRQLFFCKRLRQGKKLENSAIIVESGGNTIPPHPSFSFQNPLRFSTPVRRHCISRKRARGGVDFFCSTSHTLPSPFLPSSWRFQISYFFLFSAAKREKEKLLILITEERHVTSFQKEPVDFPFRFCSQWLPGKR